VYVRLAAAWADPSGAVHGPGEFVDVDVVTLAALEEQGVVENAGEENEDFTGPGESDEEEPGYVGPSYVGPSYVGPSYVGPSEETEEEEEASDDE
jgi:hypothetical protein